MAATTSDADSKIDWLYPELLSKEGLTEILSQRFVKLPDDTDSMSKDDLLELYYQYVIPRPQRKYRLNRRGRDMAKKQVLQNKKRKITGPDNSNSAEPSVKKSATPESSRLLTSFDGLPSGDRLKPPPSCVSFDKKVIKLGASKTPTSHSSAAAITPQSNTETGSSPTAPKIIKLSRTSSSSSDPKSPTSPQQTGMTLNKTIKLINSHLGPSSTEQVKKTEDADKQVQPMEVDSPEAVTTKKVKINKISWP